MKYTVRYAHLERFYVKECDKLSNGSRIARMGNTGQSTAKHLHIDCVCGAHTKLYSLKDIENNNPYPALRELNYFIDKELFKNNFVITTNIADCLYQKDYGKLHLGYDIVPENRHDKNASLDIYWNRSMNGTVIKTGYDEKGYGNYVYVEFEK